MTLLDARPEAPKPGPPPTPSAPPSPSTPAKPGRLVDLFEYGLDSPICLTWELTYACNLSCVHCLSSSGRRDPRELSTEECKAVIDELERMQVFYVNIGGGEPTVRSDFWELVDYATAHKVGVKFSTNGVKITPEVAQKLASSDYVDVQISLDGATAEVNDHVRGPGSYATAMRAMQNMKDAGFTGFKISVVCTRQNIPQLDEFKAIADEYGAQLRLTRLRPSGRGADVWDELHPLPEQQRELYDWLVANGDNVLTGDSFFHLSAYGSALPGLNLCGAGRVVCLIDPVGDVYACPFAIHDEFLAGNVRETGGFQEVWRNSELFTRLRKPQSGGACTSCSFFDSCKGGCMAAKFFTGLPLDGPDPECVRGFGEAALEKRKMDGSIPKPEGDHSHSTVRGPRRDGKPSSTGLITADAVKTRRPVAVTLSLTRPAHPPVSACEENPLAGFTPGH
ncbi:mycofactocin radical SAM maturase [Herbiconiux sp. CPCC 205763]|uniref:Mycofactocin radical SAM maturase n=1 Tax=Herbiconiux aconitum TaxID=2970913 RepID=A0ABT2GYE7_9MICO|nr:mycofactocin radical SAM maturase [Herbiconiux aconitum]MCS5719959.1 mycofactocin radical SAM maturase [Herbiconiux aconitum]